MFILTISEILLLEGRLVLGSAQRVSRSEMVNEYFKWPSRENYLAYKKIKKESNTLIRKTKKKVQNINKHVTSKTFWNAAKHFKPRLRDLNQD